MLASEACIWMVGWSICISLSGLHSCVDNVRLVISGVGVQICRLSFVCG